MLFIAYFFIISLWFVQFECDVYKDRPKIKATDGDLVLEPAYGKNIYLRQNGPESNVYIGDVNLINILNTTQNAPYNPQNTDQQRDGKISPDILDRIERLEHTTNMLAADFVFNVSILARRVNTLNNRVRTLQNILSAKPVDNCQSHPCENGGTCLNLANGHYCLCPSNWKGANCEEDVNECRIYAGTDLGCQNGATCINKPGSYECLCKPGWYGLDCTRKAKDCSGGDYEMCGHGTCVPVTTGDGIKCICNQGWTTNGTGVTCLTDVNECESGQGARCSINPRVECINLPGSFKCGRCPTGYEGDGFSCYDIDECVTVPNGGCSTRPFVSCYNTIGSRICGSCPPGYQGDGVTCTWRGSCAINRGGCHPLAQCMENSVSGSQVAQCICPYGMEGDGIGPHGCYVGVHDNTTQTCENNPCRNGQCHQLTQGYTCICYPGYTGVHCERINDLCGDNPCQNGGTCRLDGNLAKGFRCECSSLYSGDLCQLHSQPCGGVLDAEEGSITYPMYNGSYRNNVRCAWVIHTVPDKVINVTFSQFNLEFENQCQYDFVQIHDGRNSASQLIGKFCGNSLPNGGNIISSHNNLYFWFRSDQSVTKNGFALHWKSVPPVCGGELDARTHGHISSPGSPGHYPPNRDCYWHLTTNFGKRIQLHFFQLDIEAHANCSFDYVAIYDGEQKTDPLLGKYCNSTQPAPIQSSGSEILIHFHSDKSTNGKGFQIAYAPIEGVPGCGGLFTIDKGEISSPSFDGSYLNNLLCEYKIKTRPETKIHVNFKSFNIERSFRCRYDYLKIYDGDSTDSRLIGKFCGKALPASFTSTTNSLYIIFKTDHTTASGGFKIKYESLCQKTIFGDSGIIKSPGYPIMYPKQTVCEYIISTTPGKAIELTFQDFDIEDNRYYNCQYDHVEIRDGPTINSTLMGRYCGDIEFIPPIQTSSYNYMYIKFNSDMSITGRGFYANFTTVDIKCGGIHRETTGLINHPRTGSEYEDEQSCTWLLIAPEGMHIKLTWNRFDLENMPSCNSDYVQLIEIEPNNENSTLGKYCGNTLPPAITTSSNRLMIKFISDISITDLGFSLSYSFLDEKTHCGGLHVKTHGYLYSPGWPETYESNRDCTWIISVPIGQQIVLNISNFDLERPLREKCDLGDYLTLRDGASNSSPLIGKYCGSFKSKRIISTSNNIFIQFHSDFYLAGKGFKIEWDGTIRGCGGILTSPSGSITSPNYPLSYNENAECFYKIVTSSGSTIQITFTELDLERTPNCRDDYIEIFDGQDTNAPSSGRFCFLTNSLHNIKTTSNYAFIKFRSDIFITGKGFLLNYNTICNNNITGSFGVIESPGYPNKYPPSTNCLWTITVPKGNKINVTFTNFDLFVPFHLLIPSSLYRSPRLYQYGHTSFFTSNRQCDADYVQFKETSEKKFPLKICGTTPPKLISSETNSIQIKFVSSNSYPHKGFRLEWAKYGCGGHIQRRSGSLSLEGLKETDGEIECEWLIETRIGTSVKLTISDFFITETKNCSVDAIEIYNGQSVSFPMLTKVCQRGRVVVQASANLMLVRLVKRSTLRDVFLVTHFDSFSATCGGSIESLSGIIHSKNYPKNYDNNLDCVWLISVPKDHRIELDFIDFDLYSNDEDDCKDSIKIYDGSRYLMSNYSHIICPKSNISKIITQFSKIMIQFTTDSNGAAKGFKINFTMTCGATIKAEHDGVISNRYIDNTSNKNCTWIIIAPKLSDKIKLTLQHISLPRQSYAETNRHCPSSFLRVFDGDNEQAPVVDEFCGNKIPPTIISHGSALTVQLGSYTNNVTGQFEAHYTAVSATCGGQLTSEEGTIISPNFPQSYPTNIDCEWTLKTSPGNMVYVTFENFDIDDSEGCNEDYLEIRENDGGGNLLATYCGNETPTNTTTASKLYIKFHSDSKTSGRGFMLHYGFLHGNDIIGLDSGEITSPLYPYRYSNKGEYRWRITTKGTTSIALNINILEIPKYSDICINKLIIYDGYYDDAPVLETMCGIIKDNAKVIRSSSNVIYIKLVLDDSNTGSLFQLTWTEMDRNIDNSDTNTKINCGTNVTRLVTGGRDIDIQSPNYPELYDSDLNCEWILQSEPGRHLVLQFKTLYMEETANCFADYISIYTSNSPLQWSPLKENICLSINASDKYEALTFIKIVFKTDQSISGKGFKATISSVCGGTLAETSGVIGNSMYDLNRPSLSQEVCDWTIKVRPGRTILMNFEHFNITNDEKCNTYIILRNGATSESPLLGGGKYCGYEHENRNQVVSSGNYMFIRYSTKQNNVYQNFKLRYEEKNIECGVRSTLDNDHPWEVISSPNYPSVPNPYTECVWIFTGPPGQILRIDFIDRFDLETTKDCEAESIEIRDGLTRMSPIRGIFCNQRPGTTKTTSNTVFIKYSTQLAEPRNGFKANVSIDVCGGTIISESGEIASPSYPHMVVLPTGTVCEWHIISIPGHVIAIHIKDIDLPESEKPCETKITIEEPITAVGKVDSGNIKQLCNNNVKDFEVPVETITNKVVIKLHLGKPSEWTQISDSRGFKLTFNSSRPRCGGRITTSEGFITTPGYPQGTSLRYCQWIIVVPNENRRIRLELDDVNEGYNLGVYNGITFNSKIEGNADNSSTLPKVYESTGNKLSFYIWMNRPGKIINRFKAKFSSNEPVLCGGKLEGNQGELDSPLDLYQSYVCEWQYVNTNFSNDTYKYNTIYVTVQVTASDRNICRYSDSRLSITSQLESTRDFSRNICGNNTVVSYRIPSFNMNIKATQYHTHLYFNLKWKLQPCGGVIKIGSDPVNILNIPDNYNDSIDCGWVLVSQDGMRIQLSLEGSFNLECSEEYIQIDHGLGQISITVADYCKDRMPDHALVSSFMYTYIQYHSGPRNASNLKLIGKSVTEQCGGFLTKYYERTFTSPNYPHNYKENQECTWEIKADLGYRISLKFIERFVIEDISNCTKDAVIIYDWNDHKYNEIAKVCGRKLPPSFNSTYNKMKVVFRSDNNINLDGFKATWVPICGGNFTASEKEQIIYSPGYLTDYYALLNCHYEISIPNKKIIVTFLNFEVEGPFPFCKYDNVTLTAEKDSSSFIGIYCGKEIPPPLIAYENVKIDFKTDRFGQKKGFKLSYSIYSCGGVINDPRRLSLGNKYSEYMNCTWIIEAPLNKNIILKFLYIDIESSYDCFSDFLAIFEGSKIDQDRRLSLICGRINSTTVIKSKGNKMVLQFVSDSNINSKGFQVDILFSLSEDIGCGGKVDLITTSSHILKSPLLGNSVVYENYLDCHWNIKAPIDHVIKIVFTSFHIAPCMNVNQTALGNSKCDCDSVEVIDGLNPSSLVIGIYCGHVIPPTLYSSGNQMSIRLSTDGDLTSSGFEATLSTMPSTCGQSVYTISKNVQHIKSPGYETSTIPRGLHCSYYLHSSNEPYSTIYISVKYIDLVPATQGDCIQDKLILSSNSKSRNSTINKDFIWNEDENELIRYAHFYDSDMYFPKKFILCGKQQSIDFYLTGNIKINLLTSPEAPSTFKGIDIEVSYASFCSRNYTESQGRIQTTYTPIEVTNFEDCYILITAPENKTISAYFISVSPIFWNEGIYLGIYDGNVTSAPLLVKIVKEYPENYPVFSTGRYMLIHNHFNGAEMISFDLNYITNEKGPGCGGKLYNELGRVTSPRFPEVYRKKSTCEWELETPAGTHLRLRFSTFDLGSICDQNYLNLVNRNGETISTYCSETPADYTSPDNYVKIVFVTTMNNGGTGWVADFVGIL